MRPRRRWGTGAIEQSADGVFRARLPGNGPRLAPCATYDEAATLLACALAELADGSAVKSGGHTLRGFGITFLDDRELAGGASIQTDRSRWRRHIETATFAGWSLDSIQPHDVREWLSALMAKHGAPGKGHKKKARPRLSRTTVQNTLNLLRRGLEAAVEAGHLRENPARAITLSANPGRTHEPWTYLEPAEQQRLLSCDDIPEAARLMIAFAMGTGLRQGEMWNLELRDVRVAEGKIVVRFGSKGKATKGRRIRRVPLFGIAREAVEVWLPLLGRQKNPHALLWPLPTGARRQKGKAPKSWTEWLLAAGIIAAKRHDGRPVRWHDLRHTCGSSLVAGWWGRRWQLIEVRDMLGHRSVTTTERYAHLAESALDAAARATELAKISPENPEMLTQESPVSGENHRAAPPARLERTTFGLGRRSDPELLKELARLRGEIEGCSRLAVEALEAIDSAEAAGLAIAIRKLGSIAAKGSADSRFRANREIA